MKRVDRFKYLGSHVKLDEEITAHIQAASFAIGRLRDRVFDCRDLTTGTKLKVYNQCVIPLLMYGSQRPGPFTVITLSSSELSSNGISGPSSRWDGTTTSQLMKFWIALPPQTLRSSSSETDCTGWIMLLACQTSGRRRLSCVDN